MYLDGSITKTLVYAMKVLDKERPEDPIDFFYYYLLKNNSLK